MVVARRQPSNFFKKNQSARQPSDLVATGPFDQPLVIVAVLTQIPPSLGFAAT